MVTSNPNGTPRVAVVIPTYNERGNIEMLMKAIFRLRVPHLRVLVVDDNSPDGTGMLAEELSKSYPASVLHRSEKGGLGPAYRDSFKKLLALPNDQKPASIIQMDADLSHDPAVIPQMLQGIQKNDLVIGSRYIRGGEIHNWNIFRRALSYCGNLYARLVLGSPYRDLTSGFKCWRREALEAINLDSLSSIGYNFQIETTHRACQKGFKIIEIPISFTERKRGRSKFDLPIIIESFWKILLLRLRKKQV